MSDWLGITGSSAYDVAACPPRAVLAQCKEPPGKAADRGTELHAFARCVTLDRDPANREKYIAAVSEEYRHTARGMNIDAALEGIEVYGCEVAFALNVKTRTCRKIGENIERRYNETLVENGEPPLSMYEIPFTVDLLGRSQVLGVPVELDYKSGQSIGEVEEHGQRRISAAGLMFYYGVDTVVSRVAYIWNDGTIKHDGFEFSILDAWETCDFLLGAINAVVEVEERIAAGETPTVYPDREKQCKYCGAFNSCPYWTNLINGALGKPFGEPVTPEEKAKLYDRLKDYEKVIAETLDRLKEGIYKGGPLPLDDEWEYSAREKKGRASFDASAARGLIKVLMGRLGASDEEIEAELAKLVRPGASYLEIRKRKRTLPVVTQQSA